MIELSKRLLYYKRKDIREAIVNSCRDKEVAIKFSTYFGKRPDIIQYPEEIIDFIKKGATSFHISEEKWENPLNLKTGINKRQLDELRKGWDLVLDIDCPNWEFSKLTTYLFIKALQNHGIKSISCKFSGNKGFHIGVPFKAFPEKIGSMFMKDWFPDGPKRITGYLLEYITNNLVLQEEDLIYFDSKFPYTISKLAIDLNIDIKNLSYKSRCKKCKNPRKHGKKMQYEYVCPKCTNRVNFNKKEKYKICNKCETIMDLFTHKLSKCEKCGSNDIEEISDFNPFSVVEIDTLLISSRHLYRSPYSLNEKSGLASVVINIDDVMDFDKKEAEPENVKINNELVFLDDSSTDPGEGTELFIKAFDYNPAIDDSDLSDKLKDKEYDIPENAVPMTLFPPCILKILEGLTDGRKRSLFILLNFLRSVGWEYDKIEELIEEWNNNNSEKLREALVKGQIRYHKAKKKAIPPPNCRRYYEDFGVCNPDSLCNRIKNPVNYAIRKSHSFKGKKKRKTLTDEQKEMRRKYREKQKNKKS